MPRFPLALSGHGLKLYRHLLAIRDSPEIAIMKSPLLPSLHRYNYGFLGLKDRRASTYWGLHVGNTFTLCYKGNPFSRNCFNKYFSRKPNIMGLGHLGKITI